MLKRKPQELLGNILGSRAAVRTSHLMGQLADIGAPEALLKPVIRGYSAALGVDRDEYVIPDGGFSTFNEFFGRRLKDGERPISTDKGAVVSPCDGRLSSFGCLDETGTEFTIKRSRYTLASLLGNAVDAATFKDGNFAVIYLHPRDYHRVHAPCEAVLTKTRHIPGLRYPVTEWCEAMVDNIYDKNERMVFFFDLPNGEKIALIMVAALGVGNIETPYDPGVDNCRSQVTEKSFSPAPRVNTGDDLGAFLLGSTVVLIGSNAAYSLDPGLVTGPTKLGLRIGGTQKSVKTKP